MYINEGKSCARDRVLGHVQHCLGLKFGQRDGAARRHLEKTAARHQTTARLLKRLRTNFRLGSTSSHDPAQKHMSMHHHSIFGTSRSLGAMLSKLINPSPKGRCVLVSSPCSVPSESIRWMAPIRPRSFSRNSDTAPGRGSFAPCCRAPTTAHM